MPDHNVRTNKNRFLVHWGVLFGCLMAGHIAGGQTPSADLAKSLGIEFPSGSSSQVILQRDGKRYLIDAGAKSISELPAGPASSTNAPAANAPAGNARALFATNCAACHGPDGKGNKAIGTPNFTDPTFQRSQSDTDFSNAIHNGKSGRMPAWSGKLTEPEMASLVTYVRTFGGGQTQSGPAVSSSAPAASQPAAPEIYEPGDDVLMSLPTGRETARHGVYVNFAHRFAYDPAFTGTGRGEALFGLDGFAIPSFGFTYGITDRFSASIYRSPSIINRPIQLMVAYQLLDEHRGSPFTLKVRASIEGQNNFRKNYTENIEGIFARSLTKKAQFYAVPTLSFNDRRLVQGGTRSRDILDLPGVNTFSLGFGLAVDIRPTVALLAEVIPTLVNGSDLGIHRPAYSFGIQKKIYRHAFTFGFSTSPGTTVSQRAGTRATFLGDPSADKPGGLFAGFDLTRQIH
jgi:mono/diheme cytochrome c family protein